jgi:hypothetical protein
MGIIFNFSLITGFFFFQVIRCYKMIEVAEMELKGSLSGNESPFYQSMPQSPVGVLDAVTGSYSTSDSIKSASAITIACSFEESPAAKRRKL